MISTFAGRAVGLAVREAFSARMRRHGVPSEVLTDYGRQFTDRFTKPIRAEVMNDRVRRENGTPTRTAGCRRVLGSCRTGEVVAAAWP